ncbi:MAG: hypothetical protein JXA20_14040 [Spirochaetes bacterium]|nr:hypothetical protein [Spirochaetota bacterium]
MSTGSSKKTTSKKSGGAAVNKTKGKTRKEELRFQLSKIIKELDEEGLAFLIKQGMVLRHNQQVDEIQRSLAKAKDAPKPGKKGKASPARAGADKGSMEIVEGEKSSHFIFVINNYRNFFSLEEMRKIVALCHAASDARDGAMRLYSWFKRERIDVINNTAIDGPGDQALATMYKAIIAKYTVKG